MKKIFWTFAFVFLTACSEDNGTHPVTTQNPPPSEKTQVGPYKVTFNSNNTYTHTIKININQPEGFVDYQINTPKNASVEISDIQLKVQGCSGSQVDHKIFWIPNIDNPKLGQQVGLKMIFRTQGSITGSLTHSIKGLSQCTGLELTTTLRYFPPIDN